MSTPASFIFNLYDSDSWGFLMRLGAPFLPALAAVGDKPKGLVIS